MNISLDCIPCIVSNLLKLLKTGIISEDAREPAMRLALAGNVIDFGSQCQLDVLETINRVINAHLAIDDSQKL